MAILEKKRADGRTETGRDLASAGYGLEDGLAGGPVSLGRWLVAAALVVFGVQSFVYRGYLKGLELVPEWLPGHDLWAYAAGMLLIAGGVCLAIPMRGRLAAVVLADFFLLSALLKRGWGIGVVWRDLSQRTVLVEALAFAGGLLWLAGMWPGRRTAGWLSIELVGRWLFALAMAVFGLDHLKALRFVAMLVPGWIPWHVFWVYASAYGFFAAAVAFAAGRFTRAAGGVLAVMFLIWVVTLHLPRVVGSLSNPDEWNSAFVCLAMGGFCLVVAGSGSGRVGGVQGNG